MSLWPGEVTFLRVDAVIHDTFIQQFPNDSTMNHREACDITSERFVVEVRQLEDLLHSFGRST